MEHAAVAHSAKRRGGWTLHGWLGVALVGTCWPLNWLLPGLRTQLLFFPLWLGYVLTVDALVLRRRGTSLLSRSRGWFAALFLMSVPAWWFFEAVNERTGNWIYVGAEHFGDLAYFVMASIAFATVIPAVMETAELVRSFRWIDWWRYGPVLIPSTPLLSAMLLTGIAMFTAAMIWPALCYPLVWGCAFFVLEPLNVWLGRGSLFDFLQHGDWRPVIALAFGTLVCGFFWEMWNYYAYPKWIYHTPGAGFWYVFEMPLIGFTGYIVFGLELYAFVRSIAGNRNVIRL